MTAWTSQPAGADVTLAQGEWIAVIASVEKGTDQQTLLSHVPTGVDVTTYAEQGPASPWLGPDPDPDRKLVAVIAHARAWSGTLSWSKSLLWKHLYQLAAAWKAPPSSSSPPAPFAGASLAQTRKGVSAWSWPWVLGVGAAGALAYGVHHWTTRRRQSAR